MTGRKVSRGTLETHGATYLRSRPFDELTHEQRLDDDRCCVYGDCGEYGVHKLRKATYPVGVCDEHARLLARSP